MIDKIKTTIKEKEKELDGLLTLEQKPVELDALPTSSEFDWLQLGGGDSTVESNRLAGPNEPSEASNFLDSPDPGTPQFPCTERIYPPRYR